MAAEKMKKNNTGEIEPFRHRGWMSPVERMDEMFEDFMRRPFGRSWMLPKVFEGLEKAPAVDIFEEGDSIIVKSDMPGMTKDDIEVNLTDDTITLSGEKKKEEKIEKKNYYCVERSCGSFRRTLALPAEVKSDKAKATFKDGVLEIRIPKSEAAKSKEHKVKIEG